ncbi:VDE-like protein [Mya arenaria]|uniref:VDE-like protein n=1 Tax=Mya arenaria TaxID=6604 RepID=A0ABY7FQZ7_MYAAR|nr:uncharacterized protein LOC128214976 [Mya arenaria]WAR23729.1 VDE-like protein [Mya arenaria]
MISVILVTFFALFTQEPFASGFALDLHLPKSNPDVVCIMEHCREESLNCARDSGCRTNMECVMKCGFTNNSCLFECMNTYEDAIYDALMACLVDDHHCMTLPPPDKKFKCDVPSTYAANFTLPLLSGTWYVVLGFNKDYDCFDCQISSYSKTPNSSNFTLTERYDVKMLNGTLRHRAAVQKVGQRSRSMGVLDFTNKMMGLTMYEQWKVLDYAVSGDYVVLHYCGLMAEDWRYQGGVVYSRTPGLTSAQWQGVDDALKRTLGTSVKDYCRPNTSGCTAPMS